MKIFEMLVSNLVKKGILYEARNFKADVKIPDSNIVVNIECENMTLKVEQDKEA